MDIDIIRMIEKAIDYRYRLERNARSWLLNEFDKRIEFRVPSSNSIAFSLDSEREKPFSFFSKSPPLHWAKICDAFLACAHEGIVYFFIIEIKSSYENECEKQLINGKLFCDWLLALCREHNYPNAEFSTASMLVWEPRERKTTRKVTSGHTSPDSLGIQQHGIVEKQGTNHFPIRFDVSNQRKIDIGELISRMNRRPRR
ncbi:hypothetical protein [Thioalkalivibrio sp. HK1]|uniref:hypothetical protein n=1 Tax=Thioalkalivibrio sp. HK1 TaxID=1469245 RepID=UPI000470175C|nr:hypothetical protein [Thioalkalivibrio sp. HK1]